VAGNTADVTTCVVADLRVEQQTLDTALQGFTRCVAEAAQGTGEAKDTLAQLGITLRDQDGHLRRRISAC
jgi:hypothetical protein